MGTLTVLKSFASKFGKRLKSYDKYSTPITLTYGGHAGFKTFVGGLMSILVVIGFVIFLVSELIKLSSYQKIQTSKNEIYFDSLTSSETLNLQEGGMYFAFRIKAFENMTFEEESRYLKWKVFNSEASYNATTNQREFVRIYLTFTN